MLYQIAPTPTDQARFNAGGKQRAMGAIKSGKLISFLKGDYDPAHGPTDVERWYTASKHYEVQYVDGCEPPFVE